jgi:periodic tryptophan protein 1
MISSICWVPKGAARATPIVAEPTEEELEAMKAAALRAQESRGGAGEEDSRLAPSLTLHPMDSALLSLVQGIRSGSQVSDGDVS